MPNVSVLIPVYNGERFIKETIQSILNQTYQDFEIVIIDDASTDESIKLISSLEDNRIVLYCNERNMGIAYTRNKGLKYCKGKYIALLDHDDIAMPYRLEQEVKYLDRNKDVMVVGGHQRSIDEKGNDINKQWNVKLNPNYIKAYLMLSNTIVNGSTMFRKEFIEKYQIQYKDDMYGAEDYLFWVECSLYGKIANLDEVLLLWRVGHGSETESVRKNEWEKRKTVLDFIHSYALEKNGFVLEKIELDIVNKAFMEEGYLETQKELEILHKALMSISIQASKENMGNAEEVRTMCRKRFGDVVGKAFFLWKKSF